MKKPTFHFLKIGAVYFGTVLGAGFASGQEILTFFGRFGTAGLAGLIAAGALFVVCAAIILHLTYTHDLHQFSDLLALAMPRPLVRIFSHTVTVFLAVTYTTMLSGSGTLMRERFGLPAAVGALVTTIICFFVFVGSLKGVTLANAILTPLMAAGMVVVSALLLGMQDAGAFASFLVSPAHNSVIAAVVYVGFNLLTAAAMLVNLRSLLSSRRTCLAGSITGGGLLSVCALLVYLAMQRFPAAIGNSELPMFTLAAYLGPHAQNIYGVVLYLAMLSTAVSVGFSFLQSITIAPRSYRWLCAGFCALALPFSMVPFSILVETLYTLFGCLGTGLIAALLLCGLRRR